MRTLILVTTVLVSSTLPAAAPPRFRPHVVANGLKYGYQLAAVDLNRDGRTDLLAVDEQAAELSWYENPGWQRHVMARDVTRMINLAGHDLDGDGIPEIVLAHRFGTQPAKSLGVLLLLTHGPDVREPWPAREIDRIPTAHRVRWIDTAGDGRRVLLAAPMIGVRSEPPGYADAVPIFLYRPGEWKRELVSDGLHGILHSIYPFDWDGRPGEELLTASFLGLHVFKPGPAGAWFPTEIAKGDPSPCPRCGSSEIAVGRIGKRRILVAIEPWHGNQVVVYRLKGGLCIRQVIDDSFVNGHALAVGDLNGDGRDEIVAGFRGKGHGLYLYTAAGRNGDQWSRELLDNGIAAADCRIADYNLDGRPDVACIGAGTGNINWYENLGPGRRR